MIKSSQAKRLLEVVTPLGKDKLILTHLRGTESVSKLFSFQLEFFSTEVSLSPQQLIGKPISLRINDKKGRIRYFHGIINRFYTGVLNVRTGRTYRAEVVPWFWFLNCTVDCRIFQNRSTQQIIEELFKELNFKDYAFQRLKGGQAERLYCVQYHETTFNFISRLLEEEGIYYYFQHQEDKHILILSDNVSDFKKQEGEVIFRQATFPEQCIGEWEHRYSCGAGKTTQNSYQFESPSEDLQKTSTTLVDFSLKNYERYYYERSSTAACNITQTKLLMETEDYQTQDIVGKSYYPTFGAGIQFKFKSGELSQLDYALLEVQHEAYDNSHMPGENSGQDYHNVFTCIPVSTAYHPPKRAVKPLIQGLQTAMVVGPEGEEIYTDQYGRIKVKFHWDRKAKDKKKEETSCWIRVLHGSAGKQWGMVFIPRVGQEVIVSFLDGDPDEPLVIGSVYNGDQMPPFALPDKKTQSGFRTHSTSSQGYVNSNEFRFEDKKDAEEIYCHAQKDYKKVVEHDDNSEVKNDQNIQVKKNRIMVVEEGQKKTTVKTGDCILEVEKGNLQETVKTGDRTIEIQGNNVLTIQKGNQTTKVKLGKSELEAMQSIELKVGQNSLKIDQSGITLQGVILKLQGTMIEIKADASLTLEGLMVEGKGKGILKLQGSLTTIN